MSALAFLFNFCLIFQLIEKIYYKMFHYHYNNIIRYFGKQFNLFYFKNLKK